MKRKLVIFLFCLLCLYAAKAQVHSSNLRCEMLVDPLGIDVKDPRLSWQIESNQRNVQQTAYHIIVSSTKEKAANNEGDLWNSGKVNSSQSIHVVYKGKKPASREQFFWKVKVFTNKGESAWSEMSYWTMGLLSGNDWQGKWIGYDKASPWDSITQWSRLSARYFRKQFESKSGVKRATVYIIGLGLYELYLNGKRIGDHVLAPAPTDYRKSVLYNTYDVTKDIIAGNNAVATVLGNGRFFTMRQNYKTQKHNTFGYPKMLLQLEIEYADGTKQTVISDGSWKLNVDGPIRTNNEYDGEEYDATKELKGWTDAGFDDSKWIKPQLVQAPAGKLEAQMNEPMRIMRSVMPVGIKNTGNGKHILDMGQNFSGWLKIKVKGNRGTAVKLRFAESLQSNGELYIANLRDARVTDIYTLKGEGVEEWQPSFVYHGFRYVEINGYPGNPAISDFEGKFIYDDLSTTGSFVSSDSVINKIYRNAWWGIASNYKGMPVDCPQRNERQPWLGDRATGSGGEAFMFDNSKLYAKWLDDIEESQTTAGAIPDVAPAFWNYYTDNVTWPGTYLLVADMLHRQFGDERPISKHYASMKKWMQYMQTKYMKGFIVTKDKYGDWCVPPESLEIIRSRDSLRTTNGELISTAYYYRLLQLMKKFAVLSGNNGDVKSYDVLGENIRSAFHKKFYNNQRKCYDNNTITANLLPLYFGMAPDSLKKTIFNNIYDRITVKDGMHISTGVIGTQWLMRGITDYGYPDIAYALASNKTYPSWGYMAEQGATTIWELWNGNTASPQMNSQNHVMLLGDFLIWLYEDIAGISSNTNTTAFKEIIMKPSFVKGLNEVDASYRSFYGTIISHWTKGDNGLVWNINVPANAKAIIYIPAAGPGDVQDNGNTVATAEGIRFIGMENGNAVMEIGSGNYSFTSKSFTIK
ncbi:MAG TPA: family 78 glycoside hydrolase catalytic domain [Chitinophagaceae bacterium]